MVFDCYGRFVAILGGFTHPDYVHFRSCHRAFIFLILLFGILIITVFCHVMYL